MKNKKAATTADVLFDVSPKEAGLIVEIAAKAVILAKELGGHFTPRFALRTTKTTNTCKRCGVEKTGEYNRYATCRNTEACKRRAAKGGR